MYEITDQVHRDICCRLGPIVKYTISGLFSWNKNTQKFERFDNPYIGFQWQALYYVFFVDAWLCTTTVFNIMTKQEFPETDTNFSPNKNKMLVIFSCIMYESIVVSFIALASVQLELKQAFPSTLNQLFKLDRQFKLMFQDSLVRKRVTKNVKLFGDLLVRLTCIVCCLVPFLFVISLFHPADPVNNVLKEVFEIRVEPSIFIVCLTIVEFWGVCMVVGVVLVFLLIGTICVYLSGYWLTELMPIFMYRCDRSLDNYCVRTLKMGIVDQDVLIWVYRCLQCVNISVNEIICDSRVAFHSTGILISVVASSFAIIRFHHLMLDGTLMGFSMFLVLFGVLLMLVILYGFECHFLGRVEEICKTFRGNILKSSKRNSLIYKTAKSFQLLRIRTGGLYFNVHGSTFMEFCDQIIVNLVNTLVLFK